MKIQTLLALGFSVISLSIGVTAIASISLMNNSINEISQREIPKINALTAMQIQLERAAKSVFSEVQVDVTPEANDFNSILEEFRTAKNQYQTLAITPEEKVLIGKMDDIVAQLDTTGNNVIIIQQNQSRDLLERRDLVNSDILPTIDNTIRNSVNSTEHIEKERTLLEIEFQVQSVISRSNGYIVSRDPVLKRITYENLDSLDAVLILYSHHPDLTGQDLSVANTLKNYSQSLRNFTSSILEEEDKKQELLLEFSDAEEELDQILNGSLDHIVTASIQADQDRASAVSIFIWMAVAAVILLSIAAGIIISGSISRAINDLKNHARKITEHNFGTKSSPSRITELASLSNSFNKMTEELQVQSRLQEQFLSIASHELRSPIHPILNYASLALDGHMPYEEAVKKIFEQALRLQQLASDILDVTRIEAGQLDCHFKKAQIDEVILAAADSVKPRLNDGVSLEISSLPDIEMDIDSSRILQVLTNLLDNAVKFTQRGKIGIKASQIDNKFQIQVSDTGEGIPREILPRLFEKFASKSVAGGTQHGTGLGLFISKAIVEAHHGEISVHNNKDGGSTFVITLPITQDKQN